jgi:mannose-6-phosphate isomerase-like protein (cupin superfamily)
MFPDLGDASPEIAILHVDPKTEATQLLIRTPKALHVRQHWHSANETHTMITGNATFAYEGNRVELGPGGFNYMRPAWSMKHGQRQVPSCLSPLMVPGT